MGKFSASIQSVAKVRNHASAAPAKAEIRGRILDEIGSSAAVFDAFAGTGQMYQSVWRRAAHYIGCDTEWMRDDRLAFAADNRRVLRAIDLSAFTVFDFDAFGSPWEQVVILAARRKVSAGEKIGLALTDGSGLKLKQGGMPIALATLAGLHGKLAGLGRWQDDIIDKALAETCRRMSARITHRWQARGKTGAGVRYIGLVLEGCGERDYYLMTRGNPPELRIAGAYPPASPFAA